MLNATSFSCVVMFGFMLHANSAISAPKKAPGFPDCVEDLCVDRRLPPAFLQVAEKVSEIEHPDNHAIHATYEVRPPAEVKLGRYNLFRATVYAINGIAVSFSDLTFHYPPGTDKDAMALAFATKYDWTPERVELGGGPYNIAFAFPSRYDFGPTPQPLPGHGGHYPLIENKFYAFMWDWHYKSIGMLVLRDDQWDMSLNGSRTLAQEMRSVQGAKQKKVARQAAMTEALERLRIREEQERAKAEERRRKKWANGVAP